MPDRFEGRAAYVEVHTVGAYFRQQLGWDVEREPTAGEWLTFPEPNLLMVTAGAVFHDGLGLQGVRDRLVQDLMRLCFLMERTYAPYSKWFGTAFNRLDCGPAIAPLLQTVLHATTWQEREAALSRVYRAVGELHNKRVITAPVELGVERLWDRPFEVVWGDFPGALAAGIQDPEVRRLADRWPVGGIDQLRNVLHRTADRRHLLWLLDSR
ncbi:hypothetical protein GCM10009804_57480 [Kribbella hippodromi]|uniref:DUF4037 domain-containing protein n=1 Tax=Kribbella hippodromi TaxID=434347 RepID=A0ABP4PWG5_9ACTN